MGVSFPHGVWCPHQGRQKNNILGKWKIYFRFCCLIKADPSPAQDNEEAGEEKDGDEGEANEGEKTQDGDETNGDEKPKKSAKGELPIDANHPEVVKIVNEAMTEAEKREPELSPEEYTDVIEEAIQQRYAELQKLNPDGPQ